MVSQSSRRECGYVLFFVMIIFSLISSITIFEMSNHKRILQMVGAIDLQEEQRHKSMHWLVQIENHILLNDPSCLIPVETESELRGKSANWWALFACKADSDYLYVVEELQADECAVLSKGEGNQFTAPIYYRITLAQRNVTTHRIKLLLQSTLAKPYQKALSCDEPFHEVRVGRQSIRRLG